eukprot:TRINITY_DN112303_c0_g1_i1.p1 TRINITY_DN112303_c0_g1~~TRINITY_DN112303_c0_g1_i1.p1  ORF type:complete len:121 (-),score=9.95 TRINITY_DN112303_c0_g1_i1:214-576(-)
MLALWFGIAPVVLTWITAAAIRLGKETHNSKPVIPLALKASGECCCKSGACSQKLAESGPEYPGVREGADGVPRVEHISPSVGVICCKVVEQGKCGSIFSGYKRKQPVHLLCQPKAIQVK